MRGAMRPHYTPKLKKRTALMPELKEVFRRHRSQPIERVISLINPMLRGWVSYFAVGHSSECFSLIKDWVEKKVRRHMAQAQRRQGFGWERWSRRWLYDTLKLFNGYRVRHGSVTPADHTRAVRAHHDAMVCLPGPGRPRSGRELAYRSGTDNRCSETLAGITSCAPSNINDSGKPFLRRLAP
jgi:group II intron maturase